MSPRPAHNSSALFLASLIPNQSHCASLAPRFLAAEMNTLAP